LMLCKGIKNRHFVLPTRRRFVIGSTQMQWKSSALGFDDACLFG